ncbi:hypothetical protein D3C85_1537750 [compost metagenome]
MGIDIRDKLMVGVSYGELEEWLENKAEDDEYDGCIQSVIEDYFEHMSPYYDSDREKWFVGFYVPNHQDVNEELFQVIDETAHQFKELTGLTPRLKGGAHVY